MLDCTSVCNTEYISVNLSEYFHTFAKHVVAHDNSTSYKKKLHYYEMYQKITKIQY